MGFVMWIICCIQIISFRKKWCNFYTQTPIRCNTIKIVYLCKCNGRLLPIVHRRYSKYLLGSNLFHNKRYISNILYFLKNLCQKTLYWNYFPGINLYVSEVFLSRNWSFFGVCDWMIIDRELFHFWNDWKKLMRINI